jgi:hypothetical protein
MVIIRNNPIGPMVEEDAQLREAELAISQAQASADLTDDLGDVQPVFHAGPYCTCFRSSCGSF